MARVVEVPLDFSNLAKIDNGRVDRLLRHHLGRIANDLIARPGDPGQRKITLEFCVVPIASPEGECDGCRVEIEAKSKVPVYRTKSYEMRVTNGGLSFNQDFPDTLNQPSLYPSADGPDEDDGDDDEGDSQ